MAGLDSGCRGPVLNFPEKRDGGCPHGNHRLWFFGQLSPKSEPYPRPHLLSTDILTVKYIKQRKGPPRGRAFPNFSLAKTTPAEYSSFFQKFQIIRDRYTKLNIYQ
jgi:hypothetical protein